MRLRHFIGLCFWTVLLVGGSVAALAEDSGQIKPQPSGGKGGEVGTFRDEKIEVAGKTRAYRLVVPKSVDGSHAVPLVFAFHGLGDSKDFMSWYSRLDELAEDKGFILIYPNALDRMWRLVIDWAKDDLALFDALYDRATSKYNIDLNRVYLVGMSNGAYFTHVVASQRAGKIAAIAAHSGGLGLIRTVEVENKYAVLLIHGDKDGIVNVEESRRARDAYLKWRHPVELVELAGRRHFWATSGGINERIWTYFEKHPRGPASQR